MNSLYLVMDQKLIMKLKFVSFQTDTSSELIINTKVIKYIATSFNVIDVYYLLRLKTVIQGFHSQQARRKCYVMESIMQGTIINYIYFMLL